MLANLIIFLSFLVFIQSEPLVNSNLKKSDIEDYKSLVEYATVASFAYCVKQGLQKGVLGDKDTQCPTKLCRDKEYRDIEVLKPFNYNRLGDVGTGFYGLDRKRKRIYLVFRGTSSRRDWFANLDAFPKTYQPLINLKEDSEIVACDGCKVHKGFYDFLQKDCAVLLQDMNTLKEDYPAYKLVIIGHSLGGALALLGGIELKLMGLEPLVVTFGSPKVGNREMMHFVDQLFDTELVAGEVASHHDFNNGYIRVTHKDDIVPELPPTGQYRHGGVEYFINQGDLPHDSKSLQRLETVNNAWEVSSQEVQFPNKFIPGTNSARNAHSTYFLKITGCSS